jgi:hypothetical protein
LALSLAAISDTTATCEEKKTGRLKVSRPVSL